MKKVTSIFLAALVTFSLAACTADPSNAQNEKSCSLLLAENAKVTTSFTFLSSDITAQNITGSYDVAGVLRSIEVIRSQLVVISRIEGTPEFKKVSMDYVTALRAVLSRAVEVLEGWGSDVAMTQAEGDFERTIPKLNEFCGFPEN